MKVGTPLGEHDFEFRRIERRGDSVALVGIVAGFETSVVLGPRDLGTLLRRSALPLVAAALLGAYLRSR